MSTFSEVRDASADNSASLQDASFKTRYPDAQRLSMRRIRDVLRLRYSQGLTERVVARTLGISSGVVQNCLRRARRAGLIWPLPERLDDEALELLLFPAAKPASQRVGGLCRTGLTSRTAATATARSRHASLESELPLLCRHQRRASPEVVLLLCQADARSTPRACGRPPRLRPDGHACCGCAGRRL